MNRSCFPYGDRENANVTEFLWPRVVYDQPRELLLGAKQINAEWSQRLGATDWGEDEYNNGLMIQLDETLKLFIRSLAPFNDDPEVKSYLFSLLPENNHKGQVVFEWGVWFQAVKALCEPGGVLSDQLKNQIDVMKQILVRDGHIGNFLAELQEVDYAEFKKCVWDLLRQ